MAKTATAIYTRTSTKTNLKGDSGNRQFRASLKALKAVQGKDYKGAKRVSECISGMLPLKDRKKLQSLLNGGFSHIYVESLRALGRKTSAIEEIYEEAKRTGTHIVVADLPPTLFSSTASPAENFQRRIMAAVQEFERDTIVYRLQEGLKAKAAKMKAAGLPGKVNGRKSYLEHQQGKNLSPKKLKALKQACLARKRGEFGWRVLATKASKILRLKVCVGKDAAVTLSKQLKI
ncbi:unnamed protein product [Effrenium voratum]|uniref:Resolvase/invertase-type recombinase catalytic domain-containing protein n=1 Tax=Effrenium voratum TaxID=2562239 RepID=A0AA36JR02_9DINO|nr:unnamed protein product [Effrenium voratum]CAJ1419773.1 unnamed protein product [Effrenium voratum]